MGSLSTDPRDRIISIDPLHWQWVAGISMACGVEPTIQHDLPLVSKYMKIWTWVWLADGHNFGIRIEQNGTKFMCRVRGPAGHVTIEHWDQFPSPQQITNAAILAGFDW